MIQDNSKINPLIINSRVKPKKLPKDVLDDQVEESNVGFDKKRKLDYFHSLWYNLSTWRDERRKWAKYYNGDQWHEQTKDSSGRTVTEEEYITSQGKIPLKQNLIKSVFNSIVGQFRSDNGKSIVISRIRDKAKETEMLSNALQGALDHNDIKEVDVASLIEKGISGLCIQRITYDWWNEERRWDVLVETIHPNFIFFNSGIQDPRWKDLRTIGRVIDTSWGQVLAAFGKTPEKVSRLKEIYGNPNRHKEYGQSYDNFDDERYHRLDFYMPDDMSKCRVIEAWELRTVIATMTHDWADGSYSEFEGTMEDVEKINMIRTQKYAAAGYPPEEVPLIEAWQEYKERWFYGFYSPQGDVLDEGESPYWHGSHPFVLPPNHMVDDKMTGLVYDLYDTQRQINRLLALQDFILGTSAKNTLIIDEDSLNGQSPDDIAEEWVKVGGVIVLKLRDGAKPPFEIGRNAVNLGISDMIQMNMKILQDISGVHPSLQGQQAQSGVPAARVITEAQQSSLNLKQFIEPFNTFRKDRNEKVLKTLQQFYTEPRWIAVSGASYSDTAKLYEPQMVRDIEFDLVMAQSADSPVYRNIIDESLKEFLMNGLIDFETYLSTTSLPYADNLMEAVKKRREQAATDPRGAIAGLQQDMPQNSQAQALLQKAVGR